MALQVWILGLIVTSNLSEREKVDNERMISIKCINVIFMLFVLLDALSQEQCIKEDSVQRVTSCIFLFGLGFESSGIILISQNLREMCLGQQHQWLGATMKRRLVITRAVM